MAIGSLREQIEKDSATLKTAESDSKAGGNTASAAWTQAAQAVNDKHQADFDEAERELHRRQVGYRTYPDKIAGDFRGIKFGSSVRESVLRGEFGRLYEDHFLEQLKVLRPFIERDNKGVIDVAVDQITHADVSQWPNQRPTSVELWKAQEDLWLLKSLFESIDTANEGAERLGKAPVRQLLALRLRGGKRVQSGGAAAAPGGGNLFAGFPGRAPRPSFGGGGGFVDEEDEEDGGGGGGGRARRATASNPGSAFEGSPSGDLLTEEFGPDPSGSLGRRSAPAAGPAAGRATPGAFAAFANRQAGVGVAAPAASSGGDSDIESQLKGRYVDDAAEYRTRAFLLHVRVEHTHIPTLLAELTNSSFPVEIVRVDAQFSTASASPGRTAAAAAGRGGGRMRPGLFGGGGGLFNGGGGAFNRGQFGGANRGRGGSNLLLRLADKEFDPEKARQGESQRRTALADPALASVRIAGLMTVYRTKEENELAKQTEEQEAAEAPSAAPATGATPAVPTLGSSADESVGGTAEAEDSVAGDGSDETSAADEGNDEGDANQSPSEDAVSEPVSEESGSGDAQANTTAAPATGEN